MLDVPSFQTFGRAVGHTPWQGGPSVLPPPGEHTPLQGQDTLFLLNKPLKSSPQRLLDEVGYQEGVINFWLNATAPTEEAKGADVQAQHQTQQMLDHLKAEVQPERQQLYRALAHPLLARALAQCEGAREALLKINPTTLGFPQGTHWDTVLKTLTDTPPSFIGMVFVPEALAAVNQALADKLGEELDHRKNLAKRYAKALETPLDHWQVFSSLDDPLLRSPVEAMAGLKRPRPKEIPPADGVPCTISWGTLFPDTPQESLQGSIAVRPSALRFSAAKKGTPQTPEPKQKPKTPPQEAVPPLLIPNPFADIAQATGDVSQVAQSIGKTMALYPEIEPLKRRINQAQTEALQALQAKYFLVPPLNIEGGEGINEALSLRYGGPREQGLSGFLENMLKVAGQALLHQSVPWDDTGRSVAHQLLYRYGQTLKNVRALLTAWETTEQPMDNLADWIHVHTVLGLAEDTPVIRPAQNLWDLLKSYDKGLSIESIQEQRRWTVSKAKGLAQDPIFFEKYAPLRRAQALNEQMARDMAKVQGWVKAKQLQQVLEPEQLEALAVLKDTFAEGADFYRAFGQAIRTTGSQWHQYLTYILQQQLGLPAKAPATLPILFQGKQEDLKDLNDLAFQNNLSMAIGATMTSALANGVKDALTLATAGVGGLMFGYILLSKAINGHATEVSYFSGRGIENLGTLFSPSDPEPKPYRAKVLTMKKLLKAVEVSESVVQGAEGIALLNELGAEGTHLGAEAIKSITGMHNITHIQLDQFLHGQPVQNAGEILEAFKAKFPLLTHLDIGLSGAHDVLKSVVDILPLIGFALSGLKGFSTYSQCQASTKTLSEDIQKSDASYIAKRKKQLAQQFGFTKYGDQIIQTGKEFFTRLFTHLEELNFAELKKNIRNSFSGKPAHPMGAKHP